MTEEQKILNEMLELIRRQNEMLELLLQKSNITQKISKHDMSMEQVVTTYLHELGMKTNLLGFKYSRTAIVLCLEDKDYLGSLTRELYPAVAKIHKTKAHCVERGIHTAIKSLKKGVNKKQAYRLWNGIEPTNSEFLSRMVEKYNEE